MLTPILDGVSMLKEKTSDLYNRKKGFNNRKSRFYNSLSNLLTYLCLTDFVVVLLWDFIRLTAPDSSPCTR